MDATLLKSKVAAGTVGVADDAKLDAITASASRKDDVYTITLTNADLNKARSVNLVLDSFKGSIKSASAVVIAGENMNSMNTFDNPNQVIEKALSVKAEGNAVLVEMPARSVVTITVK